MQKPDFPKDKSLSITERVIMHLDMDSYFASCEQQANPKLRGKPIAVAGPGWQNEAPRTYASGIVNSFGGAKSAEAEENIPNSSVGLHRWSSAKADNRSVVSAASVEAKKYGVKSGMPVFQVRKLCPQIILVEPDFSKYQYVTERLVSVAEKYTPLVEIFSIDEMFLDITKTANRFGGPESTARLIKKDMRAVLGDSLTCSIGIAPNRMLAKVASDWKKPNGLFIIYPDEVDNFLRQLPVGKICGIGPKITATLESCGVKNASDLNQLNTDFLIHHFGKTGIQLKLTGQGIDFSPVSPYYEREPAKSYSHQITLEQALVDKKIMSQVLWWLSAKVARRLRQDRAKGKTIKFIARFSDFSYFGKQGTLAYLTNDERIIFQKCQEIMQNSTLRLPVRLLGVAVGNVASFKQLPVLPAEFKRERLLSTLDKLNNRFGRDVVRWGEYWPNSAKTSYRGLKII